MTAQGYSLRQVARELDCTRPAIQLWISEDEKKGGAAIASRYARAKEAGLELLAEQVIEIADDRDFMHYPEMASALVQQQRLAVDSRKWLLSKMLPRKYGDRIEISGDPDAPVVSRIELVAVQPRAQVEPPTIEALPSDGTDKSQKR